MSFVLYILKLIPTCKLMLTVDETDGRVRAQRKFAQGAYVPPSTTQPTSLGAESTNIKENYVVHRNNISASNLLDVIALKSLHAHRSRPVVLLERLMPPKERIIQNGGNQPIQKETVTCEKVTPSTSKNIDMCLRFKDTPQKRILKRNEGTKKTFKRPSKIKFVKKSNLKSDSFFRPSVSVSDIEEIMPLKFLKKAWTSTGTEKRVTRASTHQEKPCGMAKGTQPNVALTRIDETDTESEKEVEMRHTRSKIAPCIQPNVAKRRKSTFKTGITESDTPPKVVLRRKSAHNDNTEPANQQPPPTTLETEKAPGNNVFKEPEIPSRFHRAVTHQETARKFNNLPSTSGTAPGQYYGNTGINVPSTSGTAPGQYYENTGINLPSTSATAPGQYYGNTGINLPSTSATAPGQYYGNTGINRWLDSHTETDEARASPCPSESFKTVNDVITAPADVLSMLCKKCSCCRRVLLVVNISKYLMKSQRSPSKDDIYEFDTDRDEAEDPAPFYINRKRQNTQSSETGNADEEDLFHIDLISNENSPHVIQLSAAKIPNSKTGMMKARLIPKTSAQTTSDIPLAENENLLRQVFHTLQMSSGNQETERNTVQTETQQPEAGISVETPPVPEPSISGIGYDPQKDLDQPIKTAEMSSNVGAKLVEAPTFRPTDAEFNDPISYFEKIAPIAAKFGICKVVAPSNFKPRCILNEKMKFNVSNHYISRLYNRWGPAAREMSAMKAYLATQNVTFSRVPLMDSLEVNLPKLCQIVYRNGGLHSVIEKERWSRVAEEMRFKRGPHIEKTLDSYYVKYLLPYEAATSQERKQIMIAVEKSWSKKQRKMLSWSLNPLHAQKKLLGESDSSCDSEDSDSVSTKNCINEAEDCIVSGRPMNLNIFKKVANNAMTIHMGTSESNPSAIEKEYWRLVLFGTEHVCVNAASIDTGAAGYGFTKKKTDPIGRHPWNLKMLHSNSGNVLRSLGSVLGVTVPTLHLGMVFSTSCWHRDPHGLPWMEYMHKGPSKIWYGIPDEQSSHFRRAVENLCPTSVQHKSIWLSSDITMIPPNLLREHNVSLSRAVQNPGEYIIVFPKAYSCSISTGFTISESVYFANEAWLNTVHRVFQELRDSCEPTMFPLEQLLIALARDNRSSLGVLRLVHTSLSNIICEERTHRRKLIARNVPVKYSRHYKQKRKGVWDSRGEECKICRASLFLSKVTGVIGKRPVLCLLHAVRILDTPKFKDRDVSGMELVIYFKEEKLQEIFAALHKRLVP